MPIIKRTHAGRFEVRLSVAPGAPPVWYVRVWMRNDQLFQTASFMTRESAGRVYDIWSALALSNAVAPMGATEMMDALKAAVDEVLGVA